MLSDKLSLRFTRAELSGAVADLGTLVPLAALLITVNGLNPTMVFGIAGATYLFAGLYYRIPMPVQPLKSFSSLAIALGLGMPVVAAGTLLMGAALLIAGGTGLAAWFARVMPKSLIRGIQLGVGLILVKVGARMAFDPLAGMSPGFSPLLAVAAGVVIFFFLDSRRLPAGLLVIGGGVAVGVATGGLPDLSVGAVVPRWTWPAPGDWWRAAALLVLPQLPLTLTNSVTATQDVAKLYFGDQAGRVTPRALTLGLGAANVLAGLGAGMPVCHGSGGLTAHYRFGARTGGAGVMLGGALLVLAFCFGPAIGGLSAVTPRAVLGALMVYVGAAHCFLVRDLSRPRDWTVALATGLVGGVTSHNGYGLAAGIGTLILCRGVESFGRRKSLENKPI